MTNSDSFVVSTSEEASQKSNINTLINDSNKIVLTGSTVLELENNTTEAKTLLKAVKDFTTSEDYFLLGESRKRAIGACISDFIDYLNSIMNVPVSILKDMESFEVNKLNRLPQSCAVRTINQLLKDIPRTQQFDPIEVRYLQTIQQSFKPSKDQEKESTTLTAWFSEHQWLRNELDDHYQLLESPKRLMSSFKVTIARTLKYLIEAKLKAESDPIISKSLKDVLETPKQKSRSWVKALVALLDHIFNSDDNHDIGHIIIDGYMDAKLWPLIEDHLHESGRSDLYQVILYKKMDYRTMKPNFFGEGIPEIIEHLAQYLFASLAIQPTDIAKLTRRDIAIERNRLGNVRLLEVDYMKGRGHKVHSAPLLNGSDLIAQTIVMYLELLPNSQDNLFTKKIAGKRFVLSNPFYKERKKISDTTQGFFIRMMNSKYLSSIIKKEFKKQKVGNIFLYALQNFFKEGAIDYPSARTKSGCNRYDSYTTNDYYTDYSIRIPKVTFSLSAIKNTAVHSKSDKYRDGDLVNENSHSSMTEKLSYLTDDNKEWVNQVGRVTRTVMNDISNQAYKPSIDNIDSEVADMNLRTKIEKISGCKEVRINKYGQLTEKGQLNKDEIIVIENDNTAILMLHYISEADKYAKQLQSANPEYYEKTLIVMIEWMHYCLSTFDTQIVKNASKKYEEYRKVLPSLFDNELNAGFVL
jgi:hypothetical protein